MGTPDAGTIWEKYVESKIKQVGFEKINNWDSCYYHKETRMYMTVYVDDIRLSGPEQNFAKLWESLRKTGLRLDPPVEFEQYLGCHHKTRQLKLDQGVHVSAREYDMEAQIEATLQLYAQIVQDAEGKTPIFRPVNTPFLPEDTKEAPQRAPYQDGPCVQCPYCSFSFSDSSKQYIDKEKRSCKTNRILNEGHGKTR